MLHMFLRHIRSCRDAAAAIPAAAPADDATADATALESCLHRRRRQNGQGHVSRYRRRGHPVDPRGQPGRQGCNHQQPAQHAAVIGRCSDTYTNTVRLRQGRIVEIDENKPTFAVATSYF